MSVIAVIWIGALTSKVLGLVVYREQSAIASGDRTCSELKIGPLHKFDRRGRGHNGGDVRNGSGKQC